MFRELLAKKFAPYRELSTEQLDRLEAHYQLLSIWNERMNLTRISAFPDVVELHYCESLFLGASLPEGSLRIVDVGSGPGFPGIPIAILRPECSVTLVESHQRKAVFLREAARSLSNVQISPVRAESVVERFDWLVSRAVSLPEVVSLKLAPNRAILMGAGDLGQLGKGWEARKLPWGENRILGLFHVEH
jgi:16S rRNA (guanine527-N7)-methyltransferase